MTACQEAAQVPALRAGEHAGVPCGYITHLWHGDCFEAPVDARCAKDSAPRSAQLTSLNLLLFVGIQAVG